MAAITRYLWIMVLVVGLAGVAFGIVFMVNGFSAKAQIADELRAEEVTLGLDANAATNGDVVDTAGEAQAAQDILEEHLHNNYGTYGDTTSGSPERTSYLDGTTLRNSLNLARVSFGLSTIAIASGGVMLIMGIGFVGTGLVLHRRG